MYSVILRIAKRDVHKMKCELKDIVYSLKALLSILCVYRNVEIYTKARKRKFHRDLE